MAQRLQVLLVCDLHDGEVPGTETIAFSLDGSAYEMDVCDQHAGEFRDALAGYVGAARRAGRQPSTRTRSTGRRPQRVSTGADPAAVRIWAKQNNITVSERGRISADVLEQYHAAGH